MRSLTVGSLQLMGTGVTAYTVQTPIQGLDAPDYRTNTYDKPGEDGAVMSSLFYGGRTITLQGTITGQASTDYETNRAALASACAVQRDANGVPIPIVIAFTTLAGNSYFCNAYPNKPLFDYEYATYGHFQVSFYVPSGVLYGAAQINSGSITVPTGGGFILPVVLPIVSSGTVGGAVTLSNPGNVASYPILTLTGPLTNPYISNSATSLFVQLTYSLASGNTVTVDMANKTIMLNGSSSILSVKTTDSNWWNLPPNTSSTINLSTSSSSDTGTVVVTFYPAYIGA